MLSVSFAGIIASMNPPCTGSPGTLLVVENALEKAMKPNMQETKAASSGLGAGRLSRKLSASIDSGVAVYKHSQNVASILG